jgi:hypothetical protein
MAASAQPDTALDAALSVLEHVEQVIATQEAAVSYAQRLRDTQAAARAAQELERAVQRPRVVAAAVRSILEQAEHAAAGNVHARSYDVTWGPEDDVYPFIEDVADELRSATMGFKVVIVRCAGTAIGMRIQW